jgi:outer membrane protein assembly factor BamB
MQVRSSVIPPSVTVGEGQIFACQGDIFALDVADGALRHRYILQGVRQVTAYRGQLYVSTNHLHEHTVQALRVDDGAILWRFADEGRIQGAPVIGHDLVYASIVEGEVVALSAADGSPLWRYETGPILFAEPSVAGDSLYIAPAVNQSEVPVVSALDARTGTFQWSAALPESSAYPLTIADNVIYVATHTGCTALSAGDGALRWQVDLNSLVSEKRASADVSSSSLVRESSVYLSCNERRILFVPRDRARPRPEMRGAGFVVALQASDGAVRWRSQIGDETESQRPTPLATLDDLLFVGYAGHLYALDGADGAIRWRVQTGGTLLSTPVATHDAVYVGASDGYVYAVGAKDGSLRWRAFTSTSITVAARVELKFSIVDPPQPPLGTPGQP